MIYNKKKKNKKQKNKWNLHYRGPYRPEGRQSENQYERKKREYT